MTGCAFWVDLLGQKNKGNEMKKLLLVLLFSIILIPSIFAENSYNNYHPIVIDGCLLGGSKNNTWINSSAMSQNIKGGEKYKLYSLDKYIGFGIGSQIKYSDPHKFEMVDITNVSKDTCVSISGDWDALLRKPIVQSNNLEVYKNIIKDILKQNGLENVPICIQQNYRIDLDGDGKEEVLIKAEYIKKVAPTSDKGTYSLILLRKIINEKVENILLIKDIFIRNTGFGEKMTTSNTIYSLVDVNGDGIIEIILSYKYYEGYLYNLYEIKNNQFKIVLSCGEGA